MELLFLDVLPENASRQHCHHDYSPWICLGASRDRQCTFVIPPSASRHLLDRLAEYSNEYRPTPLVTNISVPLCAFWRPGLPLVEMELDVEAMVGRSRFGRD